MSETEISETVAAVGLGCALESFAEANEVIGELEI